MKENVHIMGVKDYLLLPGPVSSGGLAYEGQVFHFHPEPPGHYIKRRQFRRGIIRLRQRLPFRILIPEDRHSPEAHADNLFLLLFFPGFRVCHFPGNLPGQRRQDVDSFGSLFHLPAGLPPRW
ncbi:hypothetical protein [Moorella sulfitireducens (nom. illeg.)]|uniref:hypothetical protein n=1 Tax=Neomoorella sulfitireducens TaxID=2972948 RepID=UPI0021ABF203|nr:hypothetical protein [Moorella sulfitireducens]